MDELGPVHEGETIELYELADEYGRIHNTGFVDCEIFGPAVLASTQTHWGHNRTTARIEDAVFDLPPRTRSLSGHCMRSVARLMGAYSGVSGS